MNDVDKRKVRVEKRISLQLVNSSDLKGLVEEESCILSGQV